MSRASTQGHQIIAFSHIPKTGGMTWNRLLRSNFGIAHLDVMQPESNPYGKAALEQDLRFHPYVRSLAGHPLKSFIDYGEPASRLQWYTFLRDPIKRFISHFQHTVEKGDETMDFETYLKTGHRRNYQVMWLAGKEDLDAAKEALVSVMQCVGFVEHYDTSLLLIRDRLQLQDFDVHYGRKVNTEIKGAVRQSIEVNRDRYHTLLLENNELDIALYDFAFKEIWPRQLEAYGEARLQADVARAFAGSAEQVSQWRYWENTIYRNAIYKPLMRLGGRQ